MEEKPALHGADDLGTRLRSEILTLLRDEAPAVGSPITERALAAKLLVSRSPVRKALSELHESGHIARTETGRYLVARSGHDIEDIVESNSQDEQLYFQVASDRLEGLLADRVTEKALVRRYGLSRSQLSQLLVRVSNEGWIAPLPGYGWQFQPALTSLKSYEDSYRFRVVIEPAAILEPTFKVDKTALEKRRQEQQALVEGRIESISGAELFDLNARFHESVIECSNNDFFVQGLVRINRLRRLIEYRQALVPERAILRCREHVALAELLLDGKIEQASAHLHQHLTSVMPEKTAGSKGSGPA